MEDLKDTLIGIAIFVVGIIIINYVVKFIGLLFVAHIHLQF